MTTITLFLIGQISCKFGIYERFISQVNFHESDINFCQEMTLHLLLIQELIFFLASWWRKVYSLGYMRTLSLNFQKATSKIEVFQSLPCLAWRLEVPKLNRAETGKLQFCLQPSEISNLLKVLKYQ